MEELLEKFLTYLGKKKKPHISKVAEELNIEEYQILGLIAVANKNRHTSYLVDDKGYIRNSIEVTPPRVHYIPPTSLEHTRLLLISDTHLGSKYDRLDILRYLYDKAENTRTDYTLHAGDLTEGVSGRPEQLYELRENSYSGQRDYVVENYPHSSVPTYFIAGNHDMWWIKRCGSDICRDIESKRSDMHYLGSDCEDVSLGGLKIRVYHGKGGVAYARSYKLQKYLDSIPEEELPHILMTGHVHTSFYMKQGNTHCFQTGCLQDLTPYARSLGFSSDKGCWWVDVYFDSKGRVQHINQELETFPDRIVRKKIKK